MEDYYLIASIWIILRFAQYNVMLKSKLWENNLKALNETTSKYLLVNDIAIQKVCHLISTFTWKDACILFTFIYNPRKCKVCYEQVETTRICQKSNKKVHHQYICETYVKRYTYINNFPMTGNSDIIVFIIFKIICWIDHSLTLK